VPPPGHAPAGWGALPPLLDGVPVVLKRNPTRARVMSAVGGLVIGAGLGFACYTYLPAGHILHRMFDFNDPQVVVPVAILTVFFWGLLLCFDRWLQVRAAERVSSRALLQRAVETLGSAGFDALYMRMPPAITDHSPLLRRIRAVLTQWRLKPGMVEADLVLQQFAVDDEEATRRSYILIRTFVWALPVLGLIGTVLGIAFAVGGFATFLGGSVDDVEVIKKSLVGITGGLSFAFMLTLLGLATSLLLMLLASSLETREEQLHHTIQQRIVGEFLPMLQHAAPAENARGGAAAIVDPLKAAADAILNHVAQIAEAHVHSLGVVLRSQQAEVLSWGQGLQDQASSAAAVLKGSLEQAAQNLRESGGEFLARLDLVRQSLDEQNAAWKAGLKQQDEANQRMMAQLQEGLKRIAEATGKVDGTLAAMQGALGSGAEAVKSLDGGLRRLADSPLERVAGSLATSLAAMERESAAIAARIGDLAASSQQTAETQRHLLAAIKQLDDLGLVTTLDAFRKALTKHADVVDKLNGGLRLTLNA
jgi:biopolymer transport protein ExbB/TolQ